MPQHTYMPQPPGRYCAALHNADTTRSCEPQLCYRRTMQVLGDFQWIDMYPENVSVLRTHVRWFRSLQSSILSFEFSLRRADGIDEHGIQGQPARDGPFGPFLRDRKTGMLRLRPRLSKSIVHAHGRMGFSVRTTLYMAPSTSSPRQPWRRGEWSGWTGQDKHKIATAAIPVVDSSHARQDRANSFSLFPHTECIAWTPHAHALPRGPAAPSFNFPSSPRASKRPSPGTAVALILPPAIARSPTHLSKAPLFISGQLVFAVDNTTTRDDHQYIKTTPARGRKLILRHTTYTRP